MLATHALKCICDRVHNQFVVSPKLYLTQVFGFKTTVFLNLYTQVIINALTMKTRSL